MTGPNLLEINDPPLPVGGGGINYLQNNYPYESNQFFSIGGANHDDLIPSTFGTIQRSMPINSNVNEYQRPQRNSFDFLEGSDSGRMLLDMTGSNYQYFVSTPQNAY